MRFTYIGDDGVRVVVGGHVWLWDAQTGRKLVKGIIAKDAEEIRRVLQMRDHFSSRFIGHKIKCFVVKAYDTGIAEICNSRQQVCITVGRTYIFDDGGNAIVFRVAIDHGGALHAIDGIGGDKDDLPYSLVRHWSSPSLVGWMGSR